MLRWYQVELMDKAIAVFSTRFPEPWLPDVELSGVAIDHDGNGRIDYFTNESHHRFEAPCSGHNQVFVVARRWAPQARRWSSNGLKAMERSCKVDIAVGSRTDVGGASQRFAEGLQQAKQLYTDFVKELQAGRISITPHTDRRVSVIFRDSRDRPVYVQLFVGDKQFISLSMGEPGFAHPQNEACSTQDYSKCLKWELGTEQSRSVGVTDPKMLRPLQPLLQKLHAKIEAARESTVRTR